VSKYMRKNTLYIGERDLRRKSRRGRGVISKKPSRMNVKETLNLSAHVIKGGLGTSPYY